MNFDEFKDEVVSLMRGDDELVKQIQAMEPAFFAKVKSHKKIKYKSLPLSLDILSDELRKMSDETNYLAIAVYSMVAELKNEEEAMKSMSHEQMMKHLDDRKLLKKSISVRFEAAKSKRQNSMVTFEMKLDGSLGNHLEIFDHELDSNWDSPFGGGWYNYES